MAEIKIVKCPACGRIQTSGAFKRMHCKFCGVGRSMKRVKILAVTHNPLSAVKLCKYFEEMESKNFRRTL